MDVHTSLRPHYAVCNAGTYWCVRRDGVPLLGARGAADAIALALEHARGAWMHEGARPHVTLETQPGMVAALASYETPYVSAAERDRRRAARAPSLRERFRRWMGATRPRVRVATG